MTLKVPDCIVISREYVESDISDGDSGNSDNEEDDESTCSRWEKSIAATARTAASPRKPERRRSLRRPRPNTGRSDLEMEFSQENDLSRSPRCPKRQISKESALTCREPLSLELSLTMLLRRNAADKIPLRGRTHKSTAMKSRFSLPDSRALSRNADGYTSNWDLEENATQARDILPPRPRRVRSINQSIECQLQTAIDVLNNCC